MTQILRATLCGVLACSLLAVPAAAEQYPPDELQPPAEGEGPYLADPSDPPPSEYEAASSSWASVNLSGARWDGARIGSLGGASPVKTSVRASRKLWGNSRSVVLVGRRAFTDIVSAAPLAARLKAPLLVTPRARLPRVVRREVGRLDASRAYLVGALSQRIADRLRSIGVRVIRLRGEDRFATNALVVRRLASLGRHRHTLVVTSGYRLRSSHAVAALAAGRRFPVVIAPRKGGEVRVRRLARDVAAEHTIVVGSRRYVRRGLVDRLPDVDRIAGETPAKTSALVARRGWKAGMRGAPVVVDSNQLVRALAVGAVMGARRNAVVFVTKGPELARAASRFVQRREPDHLTFLRSGMPRLTTCQLKRGRMRSWFCAEQELRRQGYHMPRVDGRTDRFTYWAVITFEKVARRAPNGSFGEEEWQAMLRNPRHRVRRPDLPKTHLEIDLGRQLILLVENGKVRHHIHTSTGKSSTPTVRGTFTVYEKRNYLQANHMYRSIFFHGGYAIHGYPSVPTYPASHGCSRTYNGNQDFIYPKVFIGERVATY